MILVIGHATRQDSKIYEFPNILLIKDLQKANLSFLYLRHSIDGKYFSELLIYKNGKKTKRIVIPTFIFPSFLRYFSEFITNILIGIILFVITRKKILFIGIDPLNAFSGLLLKYLHISKKSIFYSVDFSYTRFNNIVLNFVYLHLDLLSAKKSDQVWNVSSRIYNLRNVQKVQINKNKFVPNTPVYNGKNHRKPTFENTSLKLVTLGILDKQLDFDNLFIALKKLLDEKYSVELFVIGNGPKEKKLKNLVQYLELNSIIKFLGYMEHEKALNQISKCHVGLALYNGEWSFNYFGDSLKCREYFSYGLPVISTDTHSTVEDIKMYHAGIIVNQSANDYYLAIKKIYHKYNDYSKGSKTLGELFYNRRIDLVKENL